MCKWVDNKNFTKKSIHSMKTLIHSERVILENKGNGWFVHISSEQLVDFRKEYIRSIICGV